MTDRVAWTLPHLSQEFHKGPVLKQPGFDRAVLSYDFETESGTYAWEEILFLDTAAVRFTFAQVCTPEQISAYDKLVVVDESDWPDQLHRPSADLRHYRIYFDDIGCYEFLARSFVPPPGSAGNGYPAHN